jgi:PAS domain S-box-containing protein
MAGMLHTRSDDAELKASEDRFAMAFYSSPIAMAITTLGEGRYVDVNEAFERQMGYPRAEICGRTSIELDVWPTPDDRNVMIAALRLNKSVRDQNAEFRTRSGQLISTLYSAGLITLDGTPCVLAAIADITAQRRAEEALRQSESMFRMVAETMQAGIFICRKDGTLCYFNPPLERFSGYSADELRGMKVWDMVHPDSRELVMNRAMSRLSGTSVPDRYQFLMRTKNDEARWLDLAAQVIEYEGEPAIMGTGFDITDGKRSEQQAKEHAGLLQTLIANSPYGIMMGGKDHRILFCNSAFQRMFQYSEDEVIGSDPDELIGVRDNPEAVDFSRRVLGGEVIHAAGVRRRKDNSPVDVEFHAVPLMADGQFVGCFGIYQDISERIASEKKLRALRSRLTRVQDEERAHFARELHDDIGQRLVLLTIQLTQLQNEARNVAPSLGKDLDSSRRLAEELCADAQRISHRLHPTQPALLGLTKALSNLCEAFARQTGLRIDFVHDGEIPRLPAEVETCLYRVGQEAIHNATKHSQCQRIDMELSVTSGSIRLCVADAGQGFDPGATEHNSGLGLVSMAERARSVGGQLTLHSAINQGTRIEVLVPWAAPSGVQEPQHSRR